MTNIYIMIFLPISLAYMEQKRKYDNTFSLYPIALVLFVYLTKNAMDMGGGYRWEMFIFNLQKIFK